MESDVLIQMPARRIVVTQNFQLNCSITYYDSQNLTVELYWMVPQLQGIDVSLLVVYISMQISRITEHITNDRERESSRRS